MTKSSKIMIGFGIFLVACGLLGWGAAGFTAKAKTAILSGAVTGILMASMGLLASSSQRVLAVAGTVGGIVFPALFAGVFGWRGVIAWQAHAAGQPKLYVAVLLSVMAAASAGVLITLLRERRLVSHIQAERA